MDRKQKPLILKDLAKKMVFLVGPRQVGKTWLAKDIAKSFNNTVYLNYDRAEDRKIIEAETWLESTELVILDEVHKMSHWKNYLKGIYDTKPEHLRILVTGSARLDAFRQAGDALSGRVFMHRLMPFSPAELKPMPIAQDMARFLERGGFPEPFLTEDLIEANRWRQQYFDSLIREDIFDFDNIQNIKAIRLVLELLRSKVGSPVSYKSIAEDINVSPNTIKKYIKILEALYIIFIITPFSKNIARSLLKEPKIYFFDTGLVKGDVGPRLENFVAVCLLKHVYAKYDYAGENYALNYLRTKDGLEVDFAIAHDENIEQIIEVKHANKDLSKSLLVFHKKYNLPAVQVVQELKREQEIQGISIRKAINFLLDLTL